MRKSKVSNTLRAPLIRIFGSVPRVLPVSQGLGIAPALAMITRQIRFKRRGPGRVHMCSYEFIQLRQRGVDIGRANNLNGG